MASDGLQPFGMSWVDDLRYCLAGRAITVAIDVGAHGWRWGDVLLRLVTEPDTGWVATSPHERGA